MKAVFRFAYSILIVVPVACWAQVAAPAAPAVGAPPLRVQLAHGVAEPTIDTNGFKVDPAVRDELVASFKQQVAKGGVPLADDGVPTKLVFLDYKARSVEGRLILGGLDGRDHMSVAVFVGETRFVISHSGYSSMKTIDTLAERVGAEAGTRVLKLAGKSTPQ
ncbi:hypothetical protein [Pararobbsia silviterrae]|uniref:DUF4410 domain-containing protein n=1 Tax=Pararobbsia silviterrae TaxID=1792498 RepID=A0A494XS06_9BURK|nr:hypothetical protein [Pararobbsia silviterrae]RKP53417.1 hypothetical protein D7S86_17060 [Pararobbsia silviterrae]